VTKPSQTTPKSIDELSQDEVDAVFQQTMHHLDAIDALWPGLVNLDKAARRTSIGRNLALFGAAFRDLFGLLIKNGKETPLGQHFHVLGQEDFGDDPTKFEPALLLRRLHRADLEQQVQDRLSKQARHFGDDAIFTGEHVVMPGLKALDLARSLARSNKDLRSALAPVLDAVSKLTQRARAGAEAAREKAKAAAAAPVAAPLKG
jgi:hypothetical protein